MQLSNAFTKMFIEMKANFRFILLFLAIFNGIVSSEEYRRLFTTDKVYFGYKNRNVIKGLAKSTDIGEFSYPRMKDVNRFSNMKPRNRDESNLDGMTPKVKDKRDKKLMRANEDKRIRKTIDGFYKFIEGNKNREIYNNEIIKNKKPKRNKNLKPKIKSSSLSSFKHNRWLQQLGHKTNDKFKRRKANWKKSKAKHNRFEHPPLSSSNRENIDNDINDLTNPGIGSNVDTENDNYGIYIFAVAFVSPFLVFTILAILLCFIYFIVYLCKRRRYSITHSEMESHERRSTKSFSYEKKDDEEPLLKQDTSLHQSPESDIKSLISDKISIRSQSDRSKYSVKDLDDESEFHKSSTHSSISNRYAPNKDSSGGDDEEEKENVSLLTSSNETETETKIEMIELENENESGQDSPEHVFKDKENNSNGREENLKMKSFKKKKTKCLPCLANALNLDIEVEDIAELVDYADGELTNEDLIELEAMQYLEEEEDERTEEVKKKFTAHGLAGVFSKINAAMLELEAMDPNTECFNIKLNVG
ncbi:uncharacterized protein LOC111635652 [Centruroides sculpturatus]|uniref:uncharacterized protein LOC111635652 n=1 Tax=Centruroides sculpturatus TaxID=218467 RepID=UPI000C6E0F4D|nr:uncharacterized protein LOC111635652 [Centruroides sculpturatus]